MAHIKPILSDDEPRAVFVDTNFDTHFAVSITPSSTVLQLQELISLEHFNCFPKYGRVSVTELSVRVYDMYYLLPETMLLKTAFVGLDDDWVVAAEAWTSGGSLEVQRHSSYIEPATIQPSTQHDGHEIPDMSSKKKRKRKKKEDKGVDKVDTDLHPVMNLQENTANKNGVLKTGSQKRNIVQQRDYPLSDVNEQLDKNKLEHIQPSAQRDGHSKPSSKPHEIPDTSSKKKRKRNKKDKGVDKVDTDLHPVMNLKENTENKNGVLKTGSQDRNIVQQKDYPPSDVNEQLGTPNFASPPGSGAKKSGKRRKKNINVDNQSDAAITNNGCAFPEKGDAPSDNDNTINRSAQKVIAVPAEVSRSQVNNVAEAMPQQVTSTLEKDIEEDLPLMEPDNNSKESKACESKQESQNAAQKVY